MILLTYDIPQEYHALFIHTQTHKQLSPIIFTNPDSGMTFLGLGMFSMCNVRHELHNTGKKTDKLETLMIRIGMFSGGSQEGWRNRGGPGVKPAARGGRGGGGGAGVWLG